MYGWSLDDSPDGPRGTPGTRQAAAIHWNWTTEAENTDIADALGVTTDTVERYLHSEPADEVREQINNVRAEVRHVAVQELKSQLQAAGHESRTAEKPVKVWTNDDGELCVRDKHNEDGDVVGKYPVPDTMEMGHDSTARFYRREEVREILDLLTEIVGAKSPERMELEAEVDADVEHSGEVGVTHEVGDHVVDAVRDAAESNLAGDGDEEGE